jgi:hypothetical protein
MNGILTADDIAQAMEVAALSDDMQAAFTAVDELARGTIGHRLFTVMRYLPDTVEVERLYSSNSSKYPPGGRKPKQGTPWGDVVLDRGEVFIAPDADGVRAAFSDYAFRGRVLGTMNLSHEAGHFTSDMIAPGRILAALLVPMLLEHSR